MRESSNLNGVQQVAQELFDKHGKITASMLVQAAKSKDSPAHDAFEWNNTKAANEYRLWQARQFIKKVTIIYKEEEQKLFHVPVNFNDDESNEGFYKPVVVMQQDEFERSLNQAKNQLMGAHKNVDILSGFINNSKKKGQKSQIKRVSGYIKKAHDGLSSMN